MFGGALGVGIGLGLQKLASNYIAGFTILLDRSIRLGDMITVDSRIGVVSKVTSRYVVVRSVDGVEAIVPNETLVTTTVLNHSYTSRAGPHRVAGADRLRQRRRAGAAADGGDRAARAARAARRPRAAAFLVSFGDNGITLELGVWVNDPQIGQLALKSALNRAILKAFAEQRHRHPVPAPRRAHVAGCCRRRDWPPLRPARRLTLPLGTAISCRCDAPSRTMRHRQSCPPRTVHPPVRACAKLYIYG